MERPEHDSSARERRVREPTPGDLTYTGLIMLILGVLAIGFKNEAPKSGIFGADMAGAVGAILVVVGIIVVGAGIVTAVEQRSRARSPMAAWPVPRVRRLGHGRARDPVPEGDVPIPFAPSVGLQLGGDPADRVVGRDGDDRRRHRRLRPRLTGVR